MAEEDRLAQALELAKAGNRAEALPIVAEVIRVDRNNARAWILMARIVDDPEKALQCWQQVARLKPDDPRIQEEIARLKGEPVSQTPSPMRPPSTSSLQSPIATTAQSLTH
jgi:thioredoxin-like negative regulator of GroEL